MEAYHTGLGKVTLATQIEECVSMRMRLFWRKYRISDDRLPFRRLGNFDNTVNKETAVTQPSAIILTPFELNVTCFVAQMLWISKCIILKKFFKETSAFFTPPKGTCPVRYPVEQVPYGNIWISYFGEVTLNIFHNRDCSSDRISSAQWKMVCVSADFKYLWFFLLYPPRRSLT
jgi:hypothetical protein